jgi:hypothetical protein
MKLITVALCSLFILSSYAFCQVRFGFTGGLNYASLRGDDAVMHSTSTNGTTVSVNGPNSRTGFAFGVFIESDMHDNFYFTPCLLYSQKGATYGGTATNSGMTATIDLAMKYDYIDIPLLINYQIPSDGSVKPILFAGPSVGFLVNSKATVSASAGGQSASADANIPNQANVDFGVLFGGGVAINLSDQYKLLFNVRYGFGLGSVDNGSPSADVKNSYFAFMTGFEL